MDKDSPSEKIRKLPSSRLRRVGVVRGSQDQDPATLVSEFLTLKGFDAKSSLQRKTNESATWSISVGEDQELEITLEGLKTPAESTLYMGLNILTVPLRNLSEFLVTALTIADTLIGAKISLVNHDLVLSSTVYVTSMTIEDLDYLYESLIRQRRGFIETLASELENID